MTFRVGQKVKCVNAGVGFASGLPVALSLHAKYTIEDIDMLDYSINVGGIEYFCPSRFRPLTDISALQALLVPGAKIREEA